MPIKIFSQIVNEMIQFLKNTRSSVDTKPGTFTRDVVIDPVANTLDTFYNELDKVSRVQSPDLASPSDIEQLGRNYQALRKGAIKATGTVNFYSFASPPAGGIAIPQGTTVVTKALANGSSQQFVTTQTVQLFPSSYNVNTGRYEVSASVRAIIPGSAGNVTGGAVNALSDVVSGINGVYNYSPFTSGKDIEPIGAYRTRIKATITGNNVGTSDGYYRAITSNLNILDAKIVTKGDITTGITARQDIGAVDIYINGLVSIQAPVETYVIPTSIPYEIIPSKQPIDVLAKDSFTLVGSITGALVEGTHYNLVKDYNNYGGSIRARDKFVFVFGTVTIGETITITYSYNSLVESLQIFMNDPLRRAVGADVLIKQARPREMDVTCIISVLPGYTAAATSNAVLNILTVGLNSYNIGTEVQQSDLLALIANTAGVDDVTVPLTTFQENSATGTLVQNTSGNITIPADSYAVSGTINVIVRV